MPLYGNDLSTGAFLTSTKQKVQYHTMTSGENTVTLDRVVALNHEGINVFKNGLLQTPGTANQGSVENGDYAFLDLYDTVSSGVNFSNTIIFPTTGTNAVKSGDVITILYNMFGGDGVDFLVFDEYIANRSDMSEVGLASERAIIIQCLKDVKEAIANYNTENAVAILDQAILDISGVS